MAERATGKVLSDVTIGVASGGKALVVDSNKKIDTLDITTLKVGGTEVTSTAAELNALDGITATPTELNALDGIPAGATAGNLVVAEEVTFTEAGDTTYTGTVSVPAGAYILNVIVQAISVWDDGTSAAMIVGDGDDPNGFYDAVDLKATDLTDGQTINFAKTGGVEGAYFSGTASHINGLYNGSARDVTGVVTTGGQNGSAGVTRMCVVYVIPTASAAVGA